MSEATPAKRGPGRPRKNATTEFPAPKPVESTNGTTEVENGFSVGDIAILNDETGTTIGTVTFTARDSKGRVITIVKVD